MTPETCLDWLRSRRSVRRFVDRPVPVDVLERLLEAAGSAPSSTNRQPWHFSVVRSRAMKARIAQAVHARIRAIEDVVRASPHSEDLARYGEFFHEPLHGAAALVVPQFRTYPDLIAGFIESAGEDASRFTTAASMDHERCSASAAVMALLLQAHAEGLGACWMAGPMLAREDLEPLLHIARPWQMLGLVALGWPAECPPAPPRKTPRQVSTWFDEDPGATP